MQTLRAEVSQLDGKSDVTRTDLRRMQYLHNVIKESKAGI